METSGVLSKLPPQARERLERIFHLNASPPLLALILAIWVLIGEIDTALQAPNLISDGWDLISRPVGIVVLILIGFVWLGWLIIREAAKPETRQRTLGEIDAKLDEIDSAVQARASKTDLAQIEQAVTGLEESGKLQPLTEKPWAALNDVDLQYQTTSWDIGGIGRSANISFRLANGTLYSVVPTFRTAGWLVVESSVLIGLHWDIELDPPIAVRPGESANLHIRFQINERLAETLAFKVIDGEVLLAFSDMRIEIEAKEDDKSQVLGWKILPDKQLARVDDHIAFQTIRGFGRWRRELPDDERIR